jgi:outer membrane protein assembly factor BamB
MTHRAIEALSTDTGESIWRTERPALPDSADRRLGFAGIYEFLLTVMVYHDGVVLLAQPEPNSPHSYHTMPGTLYAFDARDGRLLWKHAYGAWGHCTQPDVFVVDGLVWTHVNAEARFNVAANGWIKVPDTSAVDYRIQGLDLRTGALRRELPAKELFNVGHHHRCYRNKITERFLMASRRGVEFVDLVSGENYQNHWVRSGCLLGNLPCNGLLYVAPHSCGCYIEAKLTGFNALAPARSEKGEARSVKADERLFRGSAYKATDHRPSDFTVQTSNDWPTYRHDAQRSGATEAAVGAELRVAWQSSVGGRLSAPVVAGGRVLVADVDAHTVRALDAAGGRPVWAYTAGARVASPPSVHEGLAFFGANDGRVYAVRAADGAAVWQFAAAPEDSRVTADNQLESPWPVLGVLVQDGKCWFAAGRSSYLDGGIHVFALVPATGRVLHQATIYHADPQTGKMPSSTDAHNMPGLLNDIPAGDGQNVFIRQLPVSAAGAATGHRVYSTAGYLDPTWFNRTYWKSGAIQTSGLMVLGRHAVYGMELYDSRSRETVFRPGSGAYRLVCHRFGPVSAVRGSPDPALERAVRGSPDPALELDRAVRGSPDPALELDRRSPETRSREVRGDLRSGVSAGSETRAERAGRAAERAKAKPAGPTPAWERHLPIRVTALVRAGDTLFAAGSPDTVDPADPHGAWEGRQGGVLAAFAAEDGRQLSELQLPSPPVWDGLAAANGKLYLTLMDGKVLCLAAKP